ncbi:alpha/beta hydrolase-fold protein [Streptomyces niveiscabiei]|uniref:alpha/beta hydrolase n=1 Tax=Streptomyces niveiscabiei TaxID=164115 RepID=UPI0029B84314|nr:alpha/beta hydrolase-fold protein [Streptomyces niveiscabiei]MDX3387442.1 alpha/beta hydrolase-fold protein [Streptomyces niveiscabiei]
MGLTSTAVLTLAVLAAVTLFVLTIVLWPRLARRTWRALLGRTGLLLATQTMVFASVGLVANNAFMFYASWADLLGLEQADGTVVNHSSGTGQLTVVSRQPSAGGQIQKVVVRGARSRINAPAYVYLPPEYFRPEHAKRTFPASVVLTGYPGNAMSLIKGLKYPSTAHRLAARGKMQPMILVMLRPTVAPPRDTECADVPGGPQTETFLAQDLPRAISGAYRVGGHARNWGVIGNSTGGYCALKLGLHHPDRFAASAGLSPHYKAPHDLTTGDLFHGDRNLKNRADLLWSLDHVPARASSFLVSSSKTGERNLKDTMAFISKVRAPARVSSIVLDSGGHNFTTWKREIAPTLEWIGGRLAAR